MHIKKHSTENEYIRAGDLWVRNFTKPQVSPLDINNMFTKRDYESIVENETKNSNYPKIADENIIFRDIVIVSDGYDFEKRHLILKQLPRVAVLAVNGALRHWKLISGDDPKPINAYVVNNPYNECGRYLPSNMTYYPTCLASKKTNFEFLNRYPGDVYTFETPFNRSFGSSKKESGYKIDDYRNPICAAIGLAYRFGVRKLLFLCCDDSFEQGRDYAVQLENELWTYPQQLRSQEIIDANLYWLTHQEGIKVEVADYSSGAEYNNARYIINDEEVVKFFEEESDEP
jgi:hypothetical protein